MERFSRHLEALDQKGRLRAMELPRGIDFSGNDYLGLARSNFLRDCARGHIDRGVDIGSGGSRLLRGHHAEHERLESYVADLLGAEKALYFATGFQANVTLLQTLPSRQDVIIYDSLLHASMREGIAAGQAKSVRVAHNDLDAFEEAIKNVRENLRADGAIWVAVESLYSMDGDFAPLDELSDICNKYEAFLIVDEAHSIGVYGDNGLGFSKSLRVERLVSVYTCGKALGLSGALVCADADIIDYLVNRARGFIYSTAPSPLQAALVYDAFSYIVSAQGARVRESLMTLCDLAQNDFGGAGSPIVPIIVGDDQAAVELSLQAREAGYDIRAIRPPTVPEGSARLRLSLSALLGHDDLQGLASVILPALERLSL